MEIHEVIRLASNFSCIMPLVFYLLRFNIVDKQIHLIGSFVILCGLADLITFFRPLGVSVPLVFNLQDIIQFSLLAGFYYVIVFSNRKLISWGITIYVTIFFAVTVWVQGLYKFQTLVWTVDGILIIIFGIAYLIHLLGNRPPKYQSIYSTLWINSGLLFYFCFSLWLFVMGQYILTELPERTKMIYWSCHNVNNIIKNGIIAIGISWYSKNG